MFDKRLLLDSYWDGQIPVRTDHIAHRLGFNVRTIKENNADTYLVLRFEAGKHIIEYNKNLSTKLVRACLAFAIVKILDNFYDTDTKVYKKEVLNIDCFFSQSTLLKAFDILFPKEALDVYIHKMKIYEIVRLAEIFDGWDYHMYYQMKKLKYF